MATLPSRSPTTASSLSLSLGCRWLPTRCGGFIQLCVDLVTSYCYSSCCYVTSLLLLLLLCWAVSKHLKLGVVDYSTNDGYATIRITMTESAWPSGKVPRIYADLSRDLTDRLRPDRCSFVDVVCAVAAVKLHRRPRSRCATACGRVFSFSFPPVG